jgi:alpha-ketoglutarate-dependent taurine dioxygenase
VPRNFQKAVDIGQIMRNGGPVPVETRLDDDFLTLTWDEQPAHQSTFPVSWLLAHAYDPPAESREHEILWDASFWKASPPQLYDIGECDPDEGAWAQDVVRLGLAMLENVSEDLLHRFIGRIGPVLQTEFGNVLRVRYEPGATDLALSGARLTPHTDFSTHMYTPPVLQFMLCVEQAASGGDSIVVDGFRVAEQLREDHPDHFARLVRTPVSFQQVYVDQRYFHKRTRPLIELDQSGRVDGVFFAHSHACNWMLPPDEMEPFYAAYHAFFEYLKNPAFQLQTRLRPGQCMVLRNGRLLHGRTEYEPLSGPRSLVTEFVSYEYFTARRRFEQNKHLYQGAGE